VSDSWKIQRGERRCAACGREFAELENYFSALFDRGEAFDRLDYCTACWKGETPEMFSFWQTRMPPKEEKRKLLVDDGVLVDFFLKLEGATDELKVNFRYILALVLMRKKLLKFADVKRGESGEFLVLEMPKEKQRFEIFNPQLSEEKIALLTEEVGKILNVQL
jgi:hypothetical protein